MKFSKYEPYPFFAQGFLLFQFLDNTGAASFKSLELLLLERPIIGNSRVFLYLSLAIKTQFLRLLRFLPMVLLHFPYDLVLLLQRNPLALAL